MKIVRGSKEEGKGNGRKANDGTSEHTKVQPVIQIGERRDKQHATPSNSQTSPNQPAPRIITNHQDELVSVLPFPADTPPNILIELTRNISAYRIDKRGEKEPIEWLTLRSVPASISLAIEKIQQRLRGKTRPDSFQPIRKVAGIRTILNCCIQNGLPIVARHPDFLVMKEHVRRFYSFEHKGMPEELFVRSYMKAPLQFLRKADVGGSDRYNIPLDLDTKEELGELAGNIGLTQESIAMLCVYEFLLAQNEVIPRSLLDQWEKEINVFYRLLGLKAEGAEALCRRFVAIEGELGDDYYGDFE